MAFLILASPATLYRQYCAFRPSWIELNSEASLHWSWCLSVLCHILFADHVPAGTFLIYLRAQLPEWDCLEWLRDDKVLHFIPAEIMKEDCFLERKKKYSAICMSHIELEIVQTCLAFIQKESHYFRVESVSRSTCFKEVGSSSIPAWAGVCKSDLVVDLDRHFSWMVCQQAVVCYPLRGESWLSVNSHMCDPSPFLQSLLPEVTEIANKRSFLVWKHPMS